MFTSKQTFLTNNVQKNIYTVNLLCWNEKWKIGSPCLKATTAGKAWYWQWGKWPSCTEYYMWHRQGQWWSCVDFMDEEDNWREVFLLSEREC